MILATLVPVICADATSLAARFVLSGFAVIVGLFLGSTAAAFLVALRRRRSSV